MGTPTTNYGWTKPAIGGDSNTWGTELNAALDGIDSTVYGISQTASAALPSASFTAAAILTMIKTVDGTGSGLDADLFDGKDSTYYLNASNINAGTIPQAQLPDGVLHNVTAGQTGSGRITVSASAPSGGTNGDIWLQI